MSIDATMLATLTQVDNSTLQERVYRTLQNSWHPDEWGDTSPWYRLFANARRWLG